ncbi:MAG: YqeG family HAD IIIA-type phosphatase [Acholeplasmatales bacterium]|nr:MAG: YqeG family HAD IIIA-type phosphatase [Acholeplasmatales bacterium]
MIHLLCKTARFFPMKAHETIEQIDFHALRAAGIKLLLVDLDNTLADYETLVPSSEQCAFFSALKAQGFATIIVSNNRESRVRDYCSKLGQPYVARAKKPLLSGFRKALRLYDAPVRADEVCMIGDQLLTDVLGASRMGFASVLVEPLRKKTERWYTRLNRSIERSLLKRMKRYDAERYSALGMSRRLS